LLISYLLPRLRSHTLCTRGKREKREMSKMAACIFCKIVKGTAPVQFLAWRRSGRLQNPKMYTGL
jgi:hypothetical protein